MAEFISIKDFAELAGVSTQSIYKRIRKTDNPIQPFLKRDDNQLTIDKVALNVLYGIEVDQTTTQPSLKVDNPLQNDSEMKENVKESKEIKEEATASNKVIDILREQLQAQRKDIEEKNTLIAELNHRLAEVTTLLDQQQKLSIADKKRILELEAGEQERQEKEKKRGLFSWFKWKNKQTWNKFIFSIPNTIAF